MDIDLKNQEKWILSGSLDGWGNPLLPLFELVVFVCLPVDIRVKRLEKRAADRYGTEFLPGGNKHESEKAFIEWAAGYDSGVLTGRSLSRHEKWLATLECDVIEIVNHDLDESVNAVIDAMKGISSQSMNA